MRKGFKNNIKNRIGETKIMNCGEECEIVEYNTYSDVTVRFLNSGELVKCQYSQFKTGTIKSHFTPTVFGVGITGLEEIKKNGELIKSYTYWRSMIERCYNEKYQEKHPTYKGCVVCEEWKYYKNFKKWYDKNYYEVDNKKMALDKDILNKGNKVYSPETCVFVPQNINKLFTKRQNYRGNCPIGVSWKDKNKSYQVHCNFFNIQTNKPESRYLGLYNTPQESFKVYKNFKESYIKQVADNYKDKIPNKLYEAMYRYEVHIND